MYKKNFCLQLPKITQKHRRQQQTLRQPKIDFQNQKPAKNGTQRLRTHQSMEHSLKAMTLTMNTEVQMMEPLQIPLAFPDALTSSTRTDCTYPPIEDLTRTLLKYAKTANLWRLNYPTDLLTRQRQFNAFMDNLLIVCNISPWTCQVFDLWPNQISYSYPCIGTAIYNLIFTNISDPCQKHIIDFPPDARTAILTLRCHCTPLTQDHIEHKREAFFSIKQGHQEVATSYLNRTYTQTRDCYHAGIPNTDAKIVKRAIRGGSNHHFYAASYQGFDADIRRAELSDAELLPFAELESTRTHSPVPKSMQLQQTCKLYM